jgi:hypothetical protein
MNEEAKQIERERKGRQTKLTSIKTGIWALVAVSTAQLALIAYLTGVI